MSTVANLLKLYPSPSTPPAVTAALAPQGAASRVSSGSFAALVLAALVAALVVLADRLVSTWADQHLFLGWVLLWVVIFAGLALFAGTARTLAARAMHLLDGWSRVRAQSRAEVRLWAIARSDPRVMSDLVAVRARTESDSDFSVALAPVGIEPHVKEPVVRGWAGYFEHVGHSRVRNMHLHHI